jgi:hypothetical protein
VLKIVDGVPFLGKGTDRFKVKALDLGHGHLEVVASRVIAWEEAEWDDEARELAMKAIERAKAERDPEEEAQKNRNRAARRARTRIRRLCKAMGADTLLTLTYRALETDLSRAKADLKEFNRRLLRELPGFRFVACFERQERGAWHMHLATAGLPVWFERVNQSGQRYRVKSFEVFRAIWRSVTKDRGGNVDVARRKRNSQRGPAKIASYIAKYIGKAFEDSMDAGRNRWAKYGDCEVPEPLELGTVACLREALEAAFVLLDDDHVCVTSSLDRWQEWYFLAAEKPRTR